MSKPIVIGALVVAAFIAGVLYLWDDAADQPPAGTVQAAPNDPAADARQSSVPPGVSSQPGRAGTDTVPPDPRLAALMVSPDNGLIEFVTGPDGKVIAEIDKDPNSPGFGKPQREYLYSGDRVIGLTAYRYVGDQVEITRTAVSYKPDGSVEAYRQSMTHQPKSGR